MLLKLLYVVFQFEWLLHFACFAYLCCSFVLDFDFCSVPLWMLPLRYYWISRPLVLRRVVDLVVAAAVVMNHLGCWLWHLVYTTSYLVDPSFALLAPYRYP